MSPETFRVLVFAVALILITLGGWGLHGWAGGALALGIALLAALFAK